MRNNYPDFEGYEDLRRFTPSQLQSYRQMLLEKTNQQVRFIGKNVWRALGHKALDVFELGSGNGRLLIGLAVEGIGSGVGFDLSYSRVEFANKWARDLGLIDSDEEMFFAQDILTYPHDSGNYDLAVCITGCFQYFYPIAPDAPQRVLSLMRDSATYGLFELYKRPPMGKTWKKLPEGDPWKYILDEYKDAGEWVTHTKTFINSEQEDVRVEHLKYYDMPQFLQLLNQAGYKEVLWAREDSSSMVVLVK